MVRNYGTAPFHIAVVHGGPGALGDMGDLASQMHEQWGVGVVEPIQSQDTIAGLLREMKTQLSDTCCFPVVLIGHSWGAWLSALFAQAYPLLVHKLILIGCAPLMPEYVAQIEQNRVKCLTDVERQAYHGLCEQLSQENFQDKDRALAKLGALVESTDSYCIEQTGDDFSIHTDGVQYQAIWEEAAAKRASGELLARFIEVQDKITFIHGETDPHPLDGLLIPLQANAQRVHVLQKCGHTPWREKYAKAKFFELLRNEISLEPIDE